MDAAEIVRAFIAALEAQHWDDAASYLTDDFVFRGYGPPGQVADKPTFLSVQRALQEAAPDWSFNLHIEWAQGNASSGAVYITGTHTGEFNVPFGNVQPVPASRAHFELPREDVKLLLHGDKIAAFTVTLPPETPTPVLFNSPQSTSTRLILRQHGPRQPLPAPPRIVDIVRIASFPVYGLVGRPLGLTLQGTGICSSSQRPHDGLPTSVSQISLHFAYPSGSRGPSRRLSVTSTGKDAPISAPPDWRYIATDTEVFDVDGKPFARYGTLEALERAPAIPPHVLVDRFPLASEVYGARIQRWEQPHPEHTFTLFGTWGHIDGRASGVAAEELLRVIEALVPINERPELLEQYQAEVDTWRRFFLGGQPS